MDIALVTAGHVRWGKRGGTPDEVGTVGALLMGPDAAFITGGDFLMDGGGREHGLALAATKLVHFRRRTLVSELGL
jgi:hypothetical protein